jgi:hypothetical protein
MFKLDDIVIDHLQYGIAADFNDNPLYVLTQLSEGNINITASSTDSVDNMGTLVKRFWRGKQGEFSATNAMLNLNIIGAMSGLGKQYAGAGDRAIVMPKAVTVKPGTTYPLGANFVPGSVHVSLLYGNGAKGQNFEVGTTADATHFSVASDGTLTPPTAVEDMDITKDTFLVLYHRSVTENGMVIKNLADRFPQTVHLYLKALAVDPCAPDELRACYIYLPSFQPSPEVAVALQTDATLNYTGALQVDYCSAEKVLYEIFWADEDVEQVG